MNYKQILAVGGAFLAVSDLLREFTQDKDTKDFSVLLTFIGVLVDIFAIVNLVNERKGELTAQQ
ncbi:MAG: hypothetical protein LBR54_00395 [Oscillospiraceae bacterium]|jgi:hypothetical protein|nr:hypothetical protein [Oscillospiraceae bacterium]